jgi:orotate phosphoribosyltransferase
MTPDDVLSRLEQTEALLSGHFELRSKLHSDRFFQCANVLRFPRIASELCDALVEKLRAGMGDELAVDTVIAPAMGGIIVGHEVARALDVRSIFAEKQDDALVLRRFNIAEGEKVVVAEDVITRGGRVQETIDIVRACGGEVVAVALLVDRSGGKVSFGIPTFSLLELEPVTYEPGACPLCDEGLPLVHPGS